MAAVYETLIAKLRDRSAASLVDAETEFETLAQRVWSGEIVDDGTVAEILERTGRSNRDLEQLLAKLDTISSLRKQLADPDEIKAKMRSLNREEETRQAALSKLRDETRAFSIAADAKRIALRQQLDDHMKAARMLRSMGAAVDD